MNRLSFFPVQLEDPVLLLDLGDVEFALFLVLNVEVVESYLRFFSKCSSQLLTEHDAELPWCCWQFLLLVLGVGVVPRLVLDVSLRVPISGCFSKCTRYGPEVDR